MDDEPATGGVGEPEEFIESDAPEDIPLPSDVPVEETADLVDAEGSVVGNATFSDSPNGAEVEVSVTGLEPGLHPLTLHEVGVCEPGSTDPDDPSRTGDFLSAGPVLGTEGAVGERTGDLPPIEVTEDGIGDATTLIGEIRLEELLDDDGTALVIGPVTGATADEAGGQPTGSRIACGAVGS